MGCESCRERARRRREAEAAAQAGPRYSTWVVRWPSGRVTAFADETAARAYWEAHPHRDRLEVLPPG